MKINLIEITQPIGTFYMGSMPAANLISVTKVNQREFNPIGLFSFGGVQRKQSKKRIQEISDYCGDPDATFPTPIIISVDPESKYILSDNTLEFNEKEILGEIIDGQHRMKGLENSTSAQNFTLPVIFMFDLTEEEKAYVFSIINSKQTRVPMSLIYDLFGVSEGRSPQKTCHEMARLLNSDEDSPFHKRLKMLGNKQDTYASLSQGSFIKYMLPLISQKPDQDMRDIKNKKKLSDDPKNPLRYYFIENNDAVIYKIIKNLFNALAIVFEKEWNEPDTYILSKTVGYGAILKAFPTLFTNGRKNNTLSNSFFFEQFSKFKKSLEVQGLELTSKDFPSNEQNLTKLAGIIVESVKE